MNETSEGLNPCAQMDCALMAASVRIEDEAFVDTRIELLGSIAGYNRFEALGRLAHLWRLCTHRSTYCVSETQVASCLGLKGVEALLQSELGERLTDGIRVKGTSGRIEWLQKKREAGSKGGLAKSSKSADECSKPEVVLEQKPSESYPPTPTPTLAPTLAPVDMPTEPKRKFVKPTIEQVADYCRERGNSVDAERFIDHYTSNGWKVGGNPMKDWKAAVRTWEKNNYGNGKASADDKTRAAFAEFLKDEPQ